MEAYGTSRKGRWIAEFGDMYSISDKHGATYGSVSDNYGFKESEGTAVFQNIVLFS